MTERIRAVSAIRRLRPFCACCNGLADEALVSMVDLDTVRVVVNCHGQTETRLVRTDDMAKPGFVTPSAFTDHAEYL